MFQAKEIWKDIEGYEGFYQISSWGRVSGYKGEIIKTQCGRGNSIYVHLSKKGISKTLLIKNLVAEHFIPNPEQRKYVILKNDIVYELNVDNLEWSNRAFTHYRGPKKFIRARDIKKSYNETGMSYNEISSIFHDLGIKVIGESDVRDVQEKLQNKYGHDLGNSIFTSGLHLDIFSIMEG